MRVRETFVQYLLLKISPELAARMWRYIATLLLQSVCYGRCTVLVSLERQLATLPAPTVMFGTAVVICSIYLSTVTGRVMIQNAGPYQSTATLRSRVRIDSKGCNDQIMHAQHIAETSKRTIAKTRFWLPIYIDAFGLTTGQRFHVCTICIKDRLVPI